MGRPPTLKWRTAITLDLTSTLPATGEERHWPLLPTTLSTANSQSDEAPKGGQPCKKTALYKIAPPSDRPAPAATPLADQAALEVSSDPNGGQTCKKTPLYEIAPPSAQPVPSRPLADQTMVSLRDYFAGRQHAPSEAMWVALRAVAEAMEGMAEGRCPPLIHLSSLDPGVGKTTTVICFLRALLASNAHTDVAALVCVRRKDQIEAIVKEANLDPDDFAVLTADKELNGLGCGSPPKARVLFTTHSMIERRCERSGSFERVAAFHYKGEPRAVRIWDEAILPGQPLTISRDALALLLAPLRGRYPALVGDIEDLFTKLKTTKSGTVICLPDLAEVHDVDLNEVLEVVAERPEQELAAEVLWFLFGEHVTVRQDGALGNTMLDYKDTLPHDIRPLLALDASARVRTVYDCWQEGRGGISKLPNAPKRYDDLSIHVWSRGGGKSAFRKEGDVLVEGIASTIRTRPNEEWLVVHHKKEGIDRDIEEEVRALLPQTAQVHFLNWGSHDATNDFATVPNIILAGILFMRPSYYEALGRLASGHPSSRGHFDDRKIKKVTVGEHRHLILQALCRGAVRKCAGEGCPPAHAYIIASRRSGIAGELQSIFPGAHVLPWRPVKKALKGKVAEAVEFIATQLGSAPSSTVTFKQVMAHIGWTDGKEFKRRIRHHDDFIEALDDAGIEEWGPGRWPKGFRLNRAAPLC